MYREQHQFTGELQGGASVLRRFELELEQSEGEWRLHNAWFEKQMDL